MGMVLGIIGGIVSAVGSIVSANAQARAQEFQAQANSDAEEYNAKVADNNRKIALQNRAAILAQTGQDIASQDRENRRRLGSIRAAYGAAGVDLAGSPLDVLEDTAIEGEFDIRKINYAGELTAAGKKNEADSFLNEGTLHRTNAKNQLVAGEMEASATRTAGYIGAASSLFGSFSKAGASLARTG